MAISEDIKSMRAEIDTYYKRLAQLQSLGKEVIKGLMKESIPNLRSVRRVKIELCFLDNLVETMHSIEHCLYLNKAICEQIELEGLKTLIMFFKNNEDMVRKLTIYPPPNPNY